MADSDFELLKAFVSIEIRGYQKVKQQLANLRDLIETIGKPVSIKPSVDSQAIKRVQDAAAKASKAIPKSQALVPVSGVQSGELLGLYDKIHAKLRSLKDATASLRASEKEAIAQKFAEQKRLTAEEAKQKQIRLATAAAKKLEEAAARKQAKLEQERIAAASRLEKESAAASRASERSSNKKTKAQLAATAKIRQLMLKVKAPRFVLDNAQLEASIVRQVALLKASTRAKREYVLEGREITQKLQDNEARIARLQSELAKLAVSTAPPTARLKSAKAAFAEIAKISQESAKLLARQRQRQQEVSKQAAAEARQTQENAKAQARANQDLSKSKADAVKKQEQAQRILDRLAAKAKREALQSVKLDFKVNLGATRDAIFELRRQLNALGLAGKAAEVALRGVLFNRLPKLQTQMNKALEAGDIGGALRAQAGMQQLAGTLAFVSKALGLYRVAAIVAAKVTKLFLGAVRLALAPLRLLASAIASTVQSVARLSFQTAISGLRLILGPTLAVIEGFKQLYRYSGLLFGAGFAVQTRTAINSFSQFEGAILRSIGNLGLFGDIGRGALEQIRDASIQIAQETLTAYEDVGQALEALARGGVAEGFQRQADKIAVVLSNLRASLSLRLITGESTEKISEGLSIIQAQFGLIGKEADDLSDVLSRAAASIPGTITTLTQGIASIGATANQMNVSFEETLAIMTLMQQRLLSGSTAGTAFSRAMSLMVAQSDEFKQALDDINKRQKQITISMENYLDTSRQAFRKGGLTRFLQDLEKAGAGAGDVLKLFGFRGRQIANAVIDARDLSRIIRELETAKVEDFAKSFTELLRNKTLFGSLESLKLRLGELRFSLVETFSLPVGDFFRKLGDGFQRLSNFVKDSPLVKEFATALTNVIKTLSDRIQPVISRFGRLSLVINGLAIGVLVGGLNRLLAVLDRIAIRAQGALEKALGLPVGTLNTWEGAFRVITAGIQNFELLWDIAIKTTILKLLELKQVLIDTFSNKNTAFLAGIVRQLEFAAATFGELMIKGAIAYGKVLLASVKLAFLEGKRLLVEGDIPQIARATTRGKPVGLTLENAPDLLRPDLTNQEKLLAGFINEAKQTLTEFAADIGATLSRARIELPTIEVPGQDELAAEIRSMGDRIRESIDQLGEATREIAKPDTAAAKLAAEVEALFRQAKATQDAQARRQPGVFGEDRQLRSQVVGIAEFQTLLQQGDLNRQQLDEQKRTNEELRRQTDIMRRQEMLQRNDRGVGIDGR